MSDGMEGQIRQRRRPLRAGLLTLAALAVFLCGGWSAFWFFATSRLGSELDQWMAREKTSGRIWACPARQIEGFPFRLDVSCKEPSLSLMAGEGATLVSAKSLKAEAQIWQPNQMQIDLSGPLIVRRPDASQMTLDAALIRARLRANFTDFPKIFDRFSLTLDEPVLALSEAGAQVAGGRAQRGEIHLSSVPQRPAADGAFDLVIKLAGAVLPALDQFIQSADPANLDVSARILALDLPGKGNMAARLESWRQAGGNLEISDLILTKGQSRLQVKGLINLDAEHRPEGRIDASAAGIEPLLKRFNIPAGALDISATLGNLLGGKKKPDPGAGADAAAAPKTIRLPLTLGGGRVSIGPVRTPINLLPLY